jgi:hypothetical protein
VHTRVGALIEHLVADGISPMCRIAPCRCVNFSAAAKSGLSLIAKSWRNKSG